MPSEFEIFQSLPRRARRALSRDTARACPIPPRPKARGFYADLVNARVPMTVRPPSRRSGQARVNAKRNERGEYWRTVRIRVSVEAEQYLPEMLRHLGAGARLHGRTELQNWFAVDYDVHIPGAPVHAVRAEPVWSRWLDDSGQRRMARLDYIVFYDADGQVIDIEAEQTVGATS